MADLDDLPMILRKLRAAKAYRMNVLYACEQYVEDRAAEGDAEAAALVGLIKDSRSHNGVVLLEAQFSLPAAPEI